MRLMRRAGVVVGLALVGAGGSGCYHTIITTDLPPSSEVHHEPWKAAFIAGLVPAQVDASTYCQGRRWARVETQQSFLNVVVAIVTWSIFTPMDVKVTCAAAGAMLPADAPAVRLGSTATAQMRNEGLAAAIEVARATGEAVYVAF